MTHNSLHVVIVGQILPPKIVIVRQPSYILMGGPIKEFYKDFSPLIENNFYEIAVSKVTTAIYCVSYFRDMTLLKFAR